MFKKASRILLIVLGVMEILIPLYTAMDTGYTSTLAFVMALIYGVLKSILCFSVSILLNETDAFKEKIRFMAERVEHIKTNNHLK